MIKFEDSVIDVYGEEKYKLLTINVDNKTVGYIDYSVFEDNPYIKYIEVKDEYRRKGYGKKLIEKLQSLYPDSEIDFGMMTDDGSKLYKSLKKEIIPNKDYPKKIQYLEKINNWLKKYGSITNKDVEDWSEEDIAYLRKYADIWKKYHDKQQDIEDWLNNNKKQIVKIKHNLNESWTDSYDLYDIYENYQPYDVLMSFVEGEQNIWFPLIKPSEYKQALLEFMKMGELVRFPKDKVFKWLEIIMKNTCIIDAITSLAGHTAWFPYDDCRNVYNELEDAESDYYIFSEFLDEKGFYNWCKLPDGSDAWSDYGLQPLWNILDEYQENMTAEQVLVLVNRCLDVTHQRGDLPSAFIEGGSSSLTKISNESVERKLNESIKSINEDFSDTKLITSPYELDAYLKNNSETRVVYDTMKKWYLVGNSETSIHINLISDAFVDGYYEPFEYNGKLVNPTNDLDGTIGKLYYEMNPNRFILFRVSLDELNGEEYYYDRYKYCYIYPNYCIFDRNQDFQKTSLYKVLGEPLDLEFIGDIDDDEDLYESLIKESITFEPTDDYFAIGGKEFHEEGSKVYNIYDNDVKIGMLAIDEYNGHISIDGLKILPKFRKQGFGKQVVDILKKKYKSIYVRSIPSAKKFWKKQGHNAYYNNDSGTYDGDLIYDFDESKLNESVVYRGYDKKYGVITHPDWIYVTEDLEQARYYASKDGSVKNGGVIEYDIDDNLYFLTLDEVNEYMSEYDEEYTLNDLLWYQQGLSDYLINYGDGIKFQDPYFSNHTVYILFDTDYLKNGKEINLNEELNESIEQMDYSNEFGGVVYPKIILKNPTKKELRDFKDVKEWRVMKHKDGSWYFFVGYIHYELPISDILDVNGIFYHNKENTFYIRYGNDEVYSYFDENDSVDEIKGYLYNDEYIMNTFTNLKVKLITTSVPLEESIAYAEMNDDDMVVILHNPTRKELKDNDLDNECRLIYDGNKGYYFASSVWTHEQIEQKLQTNNLPYSETSGEFYYYQDNLFATRDDWSSEEEYQEYKNDWYQSLKSMPYIAKNFGNFKVEIFKGEYLSESVYPENKYVFPYPDWGNLADIIDPNDNYRYWVDGIEAKIENPQLKNIPVNKIRQDYDGDDDMIEYDYNQFDNGINTPIDVVKYKDQYILMDGHHRAAYAKVNGLKTIKAYVYDADELENLNESIAYAESNNDDLVNVILKNPTRKELYDNCTAARVVIDTSTGDFYFCAANDFIHDQMIDKIGVGSNDSMFYDYYENTFYIRDEWEDEEDLEEFYNENKGWLSAYPYIQKNMPNFKLKMMDIYGPETPWD